MSYIPSEFVERLQREFGGRFRVRFSHATGTYHVEMRAGRPQHLPLDGENPDDAVRLRDGYVLCFELQRGPRMSCQQIVDRETGAQCGLPLEVPFRRFGEAVCEPCRARGYDARTKGAYWPFDDQLLAQLRKLDPLREHRLSLLAEVNLAMQRKEATDRRLAANTVEDVNLDIFNAVSGIETFGYAQRHGAWVDAPASPGHTPALVVP